MNYRTHLQLTDRYLYDEQLLETLDYEDEIVLYDTDPPCTASRMACRILKAHGYERVRRYTGGLEEWESIGYPLDGEHVG